MLYGKYVDTRSIRLDSTLRDLGIDDQGHLLPVEREATVGDLLAARSGVYHPAANRGDASALAPARGSVRPGQYFLYNMARLGYLIVRGGRWEQRQVIPADWVHQITTVVTPADEVARTSPFTPGVAYGKLWWILSGSPFRGTTLEGAFTATGAYGQFITVIPTLDAVVAHKTLAPSASNVPADVYVTRILPQVVALLRP